MFKTRSVAWLGNYQKGIRLWRKLQDAHVSVQNNQCPNVYEAWQFAKLSGNGRNYQYKWSASCLQDGPLEIFDQLLEDEGIQNCDASGPQFFQFWTTRSRVGLPNDVRDYFEYSAWFNSQTHTIIDQNSLNLLLPERLQYTEAAHWPTGGYYKAPNSWTDIIYAIWRFICREQAVSVSSLSFIARININEPETHDTANDVYRHELSTSTLHLTSSPAFLTYDYNSTDVDFFALLGTPLGEDVVRLLKNYAGAFAAREDEHDDESPVSKLKTVKTILLSFDLTYKTSSLSFVLENVDPPPGFIQPPRMRPRPLGPTHVVPFPPLTPQVDEDDDSSMGGA